MTSGPPLMSMRAMASGTSNMYRRRVTPLRALQGVAWAYCIAIVVALAFVHRESIHWDVVAPLLAAGMVILGFLLYLRGIEKTLPYFEIGAFYVAITAIYVIYPLLKYVLQGYRYDSGDYRIMSMEARPEALVAMEWWYVLYLASFCVTYALVRGRRAIQRRLAVARPNWTVIAAILLLLTTARLFFVVLGIFFDMRVSTYLDTYLVIQRLPLVVRQIAAQVQGIDLTLQLMFVVALTCARTKPFRILLISFLGITTISNLLAPGGRIHLVAVIITAVAAYHTTVRRVPFRWMVLAAALGFVALLLMASLRTARAFDLEALRARMSDHTEFEVIFGNGIDLKYLQDASGIFLDKPNLYWSGVFSIIPQQILPLAKDDPGAWYARSYYPEYYESGGGLAFGVLAEGVAGFGWPEMLWRGAFVGMVFALIHRGLYRSRVSVYYFTFYTWMTVWSYLTVRSGTFAPLMLITHRFLAPIAGVALLSLLLSRSRVRRLTVL